MGVKCNNRYLLFSTVFIASLCICLAMTGLYIHTKSRMEYSRMEQVVLVNATKINTVITKLLYKTQILAALVVQNDGNVNDFERVAAIIVDDPAVKNVLIAPNGVVSNVYPLEGNEKVIGLNFFQEGNGNQEAIQARDWRQLVLGGPFNLVQGGQALVGRLPIYLKESSGRKKFWGLASVTLNYPQALESVGLDQLQNQGFAYEIWRISPDTKKRQIIASSKYVYNRHADYIEKDIDILNAKWEFRISPIKNWMEYPETWILFVSSLFISGFAAFFAVNTHNLRIMKNELELLTYIDPLTGALNRRGMLSAANDLLHRPNGKFTLCYLDLNKFKCINDRFGHSVGDKALQEFSAIFAKYLNKKHIFARMGGDEFVVIFKDTDDEREINDFFNRIQQTLENTPIDDCLGGISLAFSVGKAVYPTQCQNIDDLLNYADKDMYKNKNIV